MIVVISHEGDLHARRVLERLGEWGRDAFLFDIADFPNESTLTIDYNDPQHPRVRLAHRRKGTVELTDATAVWWRRPQFVNLDAISDADARGFAFGEWHEALQGLNHLLVCPWMNPPTNDDAASRKALQLAVAHSLGMTVPDTLMTSDAGEARAFVERHGVGRTIYKIFSATHQVWRETRLVRADDLELLDSLQLAPVIFQEYIPAVADIRVTIVGDAIFPMAIDSRGTSYEVDFRVSLAEARTSAVELPDRMMAALKLLMKRFGLVYGAVDLRLTDSGDYVFLEINPAGEFLFAENGTGFPITDAVAGWLTSPGAP
jgi:glutathione synthase/RimK-type ligase-like ATP-grasp enzyme